MDKYDLVIIGSGASGLSAGVSALKSGVKDVLILEKEDVLGGNLNLFINNDFGKYYLNEALTGPELGSVLIDEFISLGGKFKINTRVLELNRDKVITYVNPEEGIQDITGKIIILAAGCREKYTGSIILPIDKFTGIFTTASAHRLINFSGYLPGKEVVLFGNDIWTLILARRLVIEGADVRGLITERKSFNRDELDIINAFDIPILYQSEVVEVDGEERVSLVRVNNIDKNEISTIECDSLVLSIGHLPETDFLRKMSIMMNGDVIDTNNNETSIQGVFVCGTMADGINSLFNSGESGLKLGIQVAKLLNLD